MPRNGSPYVGKRVMRVDAPAKVTGSAVYGVDIELPGMLHGATLRSPYPHAKIIEIDTAAALKAPGVRAVVTGKDFPYLFGDMVRDQPFLAIDRVRFIVPYVGGSYGGKNTLRAEAVAVALARFTRGRPVKGWYSPERSR